MRNDGLYLVLRCTKCETKVVTPFTPYMKLRDRVIDVFKTGYLGPIDAMNRHHLCKCEGDSDFVWESCESRWSRMASLRIISATTIRVWTKDMNEGIGNRMSMTELVRS